MHSSFIITPGFDGKFWPIDYACKSLVFSFSFLLQAHGERFTQEEKTTRDDNKQACGYDSLAGTWNN